MVINVCVLEPPINTDHIRQILEEDFGSGDITSAIIPPHIQASAEVKTREPMVMCGQAWFSNIFLMLDDGAEVSWLVEEGENVAGNTVICTVQGNARALMSGERTALNLLQTLCATATLARSYAEAVEGTQAIVLDTRKTIPGLREAQKYAVRCGGCENHRFGLYDGVLIKENHIIATGSIKEAIFKARSLNKNKMIEVEVETLDELQEALLAKADRILLDNFSLERLARAVSINKGQSTLEASGNIDLDNIYSIAKTGVDFISIGALTKNITAIDLSMRVLLLVGNSCLKR